MQLSTDAVRKILNEKIVEVTFIKDSGETRIMECTTNLDHIPPSAWPKAKIDEQPNTSRTLRVFDVKAQGWRSFKLDSVVGITE